MARPTHVFHCRFQALFAPCVSGTAAQASLQVPWSQWPGSSPQASAPLTAIRSGGVTSRARM